MNAFLHIYASYYHVIISIACSTILGFCAGSVGSLAYLRRQSMLGDALSHATLPGVVCALLLMPHATPLILFCGATSSAICAMIAAEYIKKNTYLKQDAILAIILSAFLGFGLLLVSILQKFPRADQGLINKFLFGNASLLLRTDLALIACVGMILVLILIIFSKELIMALFDETFAHLSGFSITRINQLYSLLLVGIIALGMQTVGIILMSSQLIAPSIAAHQWTSRYKTMILLSGILGAACAFVASIISFKAHTPTGPTICIVLFCCALICLYTSKLITQRAQI